MNNKFLEQYKRADSICRDIYNSESGITNYINLMRDAKNYRAQNIENWDEVLKKLMALRHTRNKLTHDVGTLDMELCSEADVLWLDNFCDSLLNATDPLANHYRTFNQKKNKVQKKKTATADEPIFKTTPISKKIRFRLSPPLKAIIALSLLILVFYLLIQLYKYLGA